MGNNMKNLILKNGQTAKFIHEDEWNRPVYRLDNGVKVCCVNLDGTHLHTMTPDSGEPDCPLIEEYQPK